MKQEIQNLKEDTLNSIENCQSLKELTEIHNTVLSKKGSLTTILKQMGKLSPEERPIIGSLANAARSEIEEAISLKTEKLNLAKTTKKMAMETLDVTIPGEKIPRGRFHPMNIVLEELKDIFRFMGYTVAGEGVPFATPEVESTHFVFDMLNTKEGHPAREESDTFYIKDDTVLRTQTSSVQIRTMLKAVKDASDAGTPLENIVVISPGRVYRTDPADATHSPVFHQCEGLVVGHNITFSNLKYTLETFVKRLYGDDILLRFRPHHFPYTEPSAEVDLSCFKCGGKGCRFCKGEGWIEMLGAGIVHPTVLENCGIDSKIYSGFAFGVGLERITMMRYEIDDLRLLYENNPLFLSKF